MPENGRRDLIRCLKVKSVQLLVFTIEKSSVRRLTLHIVIYLNTWNFVVHLLVLSADGGTNVNFT